ncbi:MAG: ribosome biogenesis GTPase Der, partial [Planctomycetes bacterium]|nr:ribosome biogenesis GTPase Der [Planctomycetota bacterium]
RLAIVDDVAGVTRDRVSYLMGENDRYFDLVDTGGLGIDDTDNLSRQVEEQISIGIDEAAVVLFVIDAIEGLTGMDEEISKRLRYIDKPILCVANKADNAKLEGDASEFYRLGRGKVIAVSVKTNRNRSILLNSILERLPKATIGQAAPEEPEMHVAIVGRRNVGKSTFVNTLVNAERMIVSEIPGTTRDSVDVRFELDGKAFVAIDTPGIRKGKSVRTNLEFYSTHRAKRSIRRADVVLMFFDSAARLSRVDKQLCKYIADQYKPCIFVVNKWDLMRTHMPTERWVNYLRDNFKTMWHVPIAFITAKTGKNVKAMLNHGQMLHKQNQQRIATSELNQIVRSAIERHPPPLSGNRRPKIYYATQVATQPPSIVMMCNQPNAFPPTYRKYLLNVFRDQLSFGEVPIKLYLRKRAQSDKRDAMKIVEDAEETGDAIGEVSESGSAS